MDMLLLNGGYVFLGFVICYLNSSKVYGFKPFTYINIISRNYFNTLEEILSFATKISMRCSKWLIIDYNNRILFRIVLVKNWSHILMVHLINRRGHDTRRDDVVFSLQVFIHMAYMIDDKMMWMSKISYENVTKIKSFKKYNERMII